MTTALSPIVASRLEKAATDDGFDQGPELDGEWLLVASTQCPLRVSLGAFGDALLPAAFSQQNVARALDYGTPIVTPMPKGAAGGRTVVGVPALHRLLRCALQLSRALPSELLHTFEKQVAALPKATEAERLVVQRVGQDLFREASWISGRADVPLPASLFPLSCTRATSSHGPTARRTPSDSTSTTACCSRRTSTLPSIGALSRCKTTGRSS